MSRVLGLDPGGSFGWALLEGGRYCASGVFYQGGSGKFANAHRQLKELVDFHLPDVIAYEKVRRHRGVDAAHAYGGYVALIEVVAGGAVLKPMEVKFVKRVVAGYGAASKGQVVVAVNERLGLELANWDECDAIAVALAALET